MSREVVEGHLPHPPKTTNTTDKKLELVAPRLSPKKEEALVEAVAVKAATAVPLGEHSNLVPLLPLWGKRYPTPANLALRRTPSPPIQRFISSPSYPMLLPHLTAINLPCI
jgi:hypothetical protein